MGRKLQVSAQEGQRVRGQVDDAGHGAARVADVGFAAQQHGRRSGRRPLECGGELAGVQGVHASRRCWEDARCPGHGASCDPRWRRGPVPQDQPDLADLAGGHADHTFDKRLAAHVNADLPILDDFAMREFTPTQSDDLYELISQRVAEGRSVAITANRAPQDWYALFPNPVVAAESLLDRLINTSHQVFMTAPPTGRTNDLRRRSPKRELALSVPRQTSAH